MANAWACHGSAKTVPCASCTGKGKGKKAAGAGEVDEGVEDNGEGEGEEREGVVETLLGLGDAAEFETDLVVEEDVVDLRVVVQLREIEGLSYEEIATIMNCPIGTVRSRIFRAREAIAEKLRPLIDARKDRRW